MTKQTNGDKLFVIDPHPVIPPSDQLKKWEDKWFNEEEHADVLLVQAFQAGADQELEACCEWLHWQNLATHPELIPSLRTARRPKPPSLKEQALAVLEEEPEDAKELIVFDVDQVKIIRRALEALND
jgi:hypothetical protein